MINLLGIPLDENSSFLRGPALAPRKILEALRSDSSNLSSENGFDLGASEGSLWCDAGDLILPSGHAALEAIQAGVTSILERDESVLSLGGDHSVSLPIVRAHAKKFGPLEVLHLDAHPDLYDELDGNRFSHACPFARMLEEGLISRLVQVGIRTMNPHQRVQAERFGVEVIEMRHFDPNLKLEFRGPLYLSLDLDVLDPAFAPGVSHHEPGGLCTREMLNILHNLEQRPVGADLVEYNPTRDVNGVTAMVAAKLAKELVALMAGSNI
jgi:arginase